MADAHRAGPQWAAAAGHGPAGLHAGHAVPGADSVKGAMMLMARGVGTTRALVAKGSRACSSGAAVVDERRLATTGASAYSAPTAFGRGIARDLVDHARMDGFEAWARESCQVLCVRAARPASQQRHRASRDLVMTSIASFYQVVALAAFFPLVSWMRRVVPPGWDSRRIRAFSSDTRHCPLLVNHVRDHGKCGVDIIRRSTVGCGRSSPQHRRNLQFR